MNVNDLQNWEKTVKEAGQKLDRRVSYRPFSPMGRGVLRKDRKVNLAQVFRAVNTPGMTFSKKTKLFLDPAVSRARFAFLRNPVTLHVALWFLPIFKNFQLLLN